MAFHTLSLCYCVFVFFWGVGWFFPSPKAVCVCVSSTLLAYEGWWVRIKCGINEYRVGVGGFKCCLEVWDFYC